MFGLSCQFRRFLSLTSCNLKNFYDTLEVSPKATQAEIKAAYYKLSLQYHPDRQEGNAEKFQKITAAYEVIGNYNTRRLYDKGMSTVFDQTDAGPDVFKSGFKRGKFRAPAPSGRTTVYDFDQWTKNHYGKTFNRRQDAKTEYEQRTNSTADKASLKKQNFAILVMGLFICLLFFSHLINEDLDNPSRIIKKSKD